MDAPEIRLRLGKFHADGPFAVLQRAYVRHATFLFLASHAVDDEDVLPLLDAHAERHRAAVSVHRKHACGFAERFMKDAAAKNENRHREAEAFAASHRSRLPDVAVPGNHRAGN